MKLQLCIVQIALGFLGLRVLFEYYRTGVEHMNIYLTSALVLAGFFFGIRGIFRYIKEKKQLK
ncbi:MAG: hypothetical protein R3Y53_04795 [Bacillota bacterium]